MMPHWMTVTLRCWIAFIAFTNFGAAFRCFTQDNFVHSKFFAIDSQLWKSTGFKSKVTFSIPAANHLEPWMIQSKVVNPDSSDLRQFRIIDHQFKSEGPVLEHMYGFWSLINGIVLLNCFFFIDEKKIIALAICVIVIYLCFFGMEAFFHKTVLIHGPTIYPCALSALTLIWLLVSLKYLYSPPKEEADENEVLRKKFPFKSISKKIR
ncbi:uncharacterized protein LOC118194837 isoform X1 [Stegodyphus dumicola]|uniref:uncharacterized protein LOC118194837 isoform X1 n=1 Tax=Stegodyphus dumicola TaxID=202533 RepID=UPI0015A915F8|nr:uncharacterized protein LOC118194837 isoform X1 [Stegodyphus dumicola]XP_035221931.1 uncharacterized protein LOC118194837 isoform X1 [Stegodyphus dumicola]XP_035221932.1 uncharacterized protein LOC118194837 isoform X1 [Stegodyphus dumicola]